MKRDERVRLQRLETVLDKWAGSEKRFLAELRTAGWDFASLQQAIEYRRNWRKLQHMSEADLVGLIGKRK